MVAKKNNKKTSKKGGTVNTDLASIAVPFGLLLAKQSLEKLSGKKMKAAPSKKKTLRVRRVAVGGANANAAANVAKANANVSGVNTMAPKTGANVGGAAKKRGRKPRSKVGGANAAANVNAAKANANVSGVNTMAPKTGANVGGAAKKKR